MDDKRQKNQLVLAFMEEDRGEAPKRLQEGTDISAGTSSALATSRPLANTNVRRFPSIAPGEEAGCRDDRTAHGRAAISHGGSSALS
jgi:hypothetical protein